MHDLFSAAEDDDWYSSDDDEAAVSKKKLSDILKTIAKTVSIVPDTVLYRMNLVS